MKKIAVVHAFEAEQITLPSNSDMEVKQFICGCGKAKAAAATMKIVLTYKPDFVLNVGTAGSCNHPIGEILVCNSFLDRNLLPLVEFGLEAKISIDTNNEVAQKLISGCTLSTCNTGDNFVYEPFGDGDVCDMEAFAIAQVCKSESVPMIAIKYVTDIVGQNSVQMWEDKLADARKALTNFLNYRLQS
ncbi:MAG: nucleosidase [Bacteroidales bacterium]|nr:nucleosidase [Bacteroidales bacterium]